MIIWPVETLQNKYKRWYEQIVITAQARTLPDNTYFEKHHIIPQSIGGSNKKINLAKLTAREHFICHRLLTRFLTGKAKMKMSFATWIMMTNNNPHQKRYKVTSRIYEFVKKEMVAVQQTEEHRKKVSEGIKKSPNIKPPWNTGIPMTAEQKEKLSNANKGKKFPPEQAAKIVAKIIATKEKNGTMRKPGTWSPSPGAIAKMRTTVAEKKAAGWVNPNIGKKASQETVAKMKQLWTPEKRKQAREIKLGKKLKPEHLENLRKAQATRRQRELEEKKRTAFVGPTKPDTAIEYRGVWYTNMNRAGKAHGISRGIIERQINAFGNSPPLEICMAIDNNTIKWPRAPMAEETKRKISQAQIGKIISDETRKKQSEKALRRVPKKLFDTQNGVLYKALAKGREDSPETKIKKLEASKQPQTVKQGVRSRNIAASKYSYNTPCGFCKNSSDLLKLYSTFTKNTLTVIDNDVIISSKFASIHTVFLPYVGKTFAEYGITKKKRN
jgi:hypothetical protein